MAENDVPEEALDALEAEEVSDVEVDDIDPEAPDEELPFVYAITAYGADYPVDALVSRLEQGDIVVPEFQRKFIWPRPRIDRFIESLLLGLPVPGIFLANESETNKLLVIDGQQRLETLRSFYAGVLRGREFTLGNGVQPQFEGKKYDSLDEEDRRRLDNSIIHATVIRQDRPSDDESSIYFVYERLNTGGTVLLPQEIRTAIFVGAFNELLSELNSYEPWREIFGTPSKRLKDQELILRFFAFLYDADRYERPMKEFLNDFMGRNRHLTELSADTLRADFTRTIDLLASALTPTELFRPGGRAMNAAVFDAVMVGTAQRVKVDDDPDLTEISTAYQDLLKDDVFIQAYTRATADEASVKSRLEIATEQFAKR